MQTFREGGEVMIWQLVFSFGSSSDSGPQASPPHSNVCWFVAAYRPTAWILHVPTSINDSELKIKYIPAVWKQRHDKETEAVVADTYEMTNERSSFSNTPSVHGRQSSSESLNARKKKTSRHLCFPDTPVMLLTNYFYLFSVCYFETLMPLVWFSLVTLFWDEICIF